MARSIPLIVALSAVVGAVSLACGSDGSDGGGTGASEGGAGGGSGVSGSGGTGGENGVSGSGGNAAGAGTSGGSAGGAAAGAGTGGGAGGTAGAGATDGGGGTGGAETIESCFIDLRALEGRSQISTRENAGEAIRLRLALETADQISTSGTVPWSAVRVALEIDGTLICLNEAELADAYRLEHHNCGDVLTFEHGGKRFEVGQPDVPTSGGGARLTVFSGATVARGPLELTTTECVAGAPAGAQCLSGGPC